MSADPRDRRACVLSNLRVEALTAMLALYYLYLVVTLVVCQKNKWFVLLVLVYYFYFCAMPDILYFGNGFTVSESYLQDKSALPSNVAILPAFLALFP